MAPILLQAPGYTTIISATAPRIPVSEYMNSASDYNFVLYARLTNTFHSLGQNTEAFQPKLHSWLLWFYIFIVQIFLVVVSKIWHLISLFVALFGGFWLGVLIVLVLVCIVECVVRIEEEMVDEEKYEYSGLPPQLESEADVQDEKREIEIA